METRIPVEVSQAEEAIREALACLPEPLAQRLGPVRFAVRATDEDVASRWRRGEAGVEVEVNESETSPHLVRSVATLLTSHAIQNSIR